MDISWPNFIAHFRWELACELTRTISGTKNENRKLKPNPKPETSAVPTEMKPKTEEQKSESKLKIQFPPQFQLRNKLN